PRRGGAQNSPPRPAMPPMSEPSSCSCSSLARRGASATAAVTRSSSISTSSGSTTLLSMRTEVIVPSPLATAVTMPAPAEPSTVISARRSWASAIFRWARCASFISFWMFMTLLGGPASDLVPRSPVELEAVLCLVIVSLRARPVRIRGCFLLGRGVRPELDHPAGEEPLELLQCHAHLGRGGGG